jgi:hypothetical protein
LQDRVGETQKATKLLLKLERNAHTRNDRYYRECKDKFLSHLKIQRGLAVGDPVLRDLVRLASPRPGEPTPHVSFITPVNTAKVALSKAGFPAVDELTLAKLFPPQPTDAGLEDMAKASAGFEGTPPLSCVMLQSSHSTVV